MLSKYEPIYKITNRVAAALAQIERARGFLEAATLSEAWIRKMGHRALVREAHHTTHIEGTQLTLDQAHRLLDGESVPGTDPDDARELLNYRSAFEFVSDYLMSDAPFTEGLLRQLHKLLVEGVRGGAATAPGEYRQVQNYVVNSATGDAVYTPPPPLDVPALMAQLVAFLNRPNDVHPILVAGIAQFQLVHIHPFVDGNGRVSRLLSTLCLYRAGYDFKRLFTISEFYDRNRPAFYAALQSVRESDMDLTGWLEYFVDGLATQLLEVKELGEQAMRRDALVLEHSLNTRQGAALAHALEFATIEIGQFEALFPGVSRRTLQRDLRGMADRGLLVAEGATNNLLYRVRPQE